MKMNRIHHKSQTITVPELDIFSVPPTQESIEKTYFTEHRPISTLASDQQIQFNLTTAADEYINLRDVYFYIKFKLNLVKSTAVSGDDWKKVNLVNNTLHTMWRYIDVSMENKSLVQGNQTYAYKAYFENLLGYSDFAKSGYLSAEGWELNFESHIKNVSEDSSQKITPSTIDDKGVGKSLEFYGKMHFDIAMQPKSLLGGCKLTFTFIPNDPGFYIRSSEAFIRPKVIFEEAALYVSRSKVILPIVEAHNMMLAKTTAKYPIMRGLVKAFPVSTGLSDVHINNAILGQIPRRVFIAMVDSKGFNGHLTYNPFDFHHFKLNYLIASLDGSQYPSIPYTPDFDNDIYVREYISLYDCLNQTTTDTGVTISRDEFKNGLAIFAINFGPDSIDELSKAGYLNEIRHGTINFNLKFAEALPQNIHVIVYCEYDNMIKIPITREPILDYI